MHDARDAYGPVMFSQDYYVMSLVAGIRSGVLRKYMDIGDDADTGQLNINGLDFERLCFFWPSLPVFQSQVRVSL